MSPTELPTLSVLQAEHSGLVESLGGSVLDHLPSIREFVGKVVAAGAGLNAKDDRAAAQGLINFWTARVSAAARSVASVGQRGIPGPAFDEMLLADFDTAVLTRAVAAAEKRIGGLSSEDKTLTRRVVLRLVRLQADQPRFEAVPTVRAALTDLDDPDRVAKVLDDLAADGVVRVSRGETPDMDRVALRSPGLLTSWPSLVQWQEHRLRFRTAVGEWATAGKPADKLATGDDLEDARRYHDRNSVEREFVTASAYRQARQVERAAHYRRRVWLLGILTAVVSGLAVAAVFGWLASVKAAARVQADAEIESKKNQGELFTATQQKESVQKELDQRQRLQKLADVTRVVRALAESGTSDGDEWQIARWRWKGVVDRYKTEDEFRKYLETHGVRLEPFTDDSTPDQIQQQAVQALNLARALKTEAEKEGDEDVRRALDGVRQVAYSMVDKVTEQTVNIYADRTRSFADAAPYVQEFWVLYWGEMGMVEDDEVAKAMVQFGEQLKVIRDDVTRQLKGTFDLSAFNRGVSQAVSELKNKPDRIQDYLKLMDQLSKKKVAPDQLKRLRELKEELHKKLYPATGEKGITPNASPPKLEKLPSKY